ncbi:MAG: hypothetical protein C0475_02740 [Planctomyces sp.]|nr:hypothetical protein [Planctomyces sp.]
MTAGCATGSRWWRCWWLSVGACWGCSPHGPAQGGPAQGGAEGWWGRGWVRWDRCGGWGVGGVGIGRVESGLGATAAPAGR